MQRVTDRDERMVRSGRSQDREVNYFACKAA